MLRSQEVALVLPPHTIEPIDIVALSQVQGWHIDQLNVSDAWKESRGSGVTVMVMDSGYNNHPDIDDNVISKKTFVRSEGMDDLSDHGTFVAGEIAASDNVQGIVGVAPECKIKVVKILNRNGGGSVSSLEKALDYAIAEKPDVINLSIGSHRKLGIRVENKLAKLHEMGIPLVCAAGNTGGNVDWPAAYPNTIAVGAYDENGVIAHFSAHGPEIDFVAPGVRIYSTGNDGGYRYGSGTSMASPLVTGIIALAISKHRKSGTPLEGVDDIISHLKRHAHDYGKAGKDDLYGWGAIKVGCDCEIDTPLVESQITLSWWDRFWTKLTS